MSALRDFRISCKPQESGHYLEMFEGSKVKDHILCSTYEGAVKLGKKWIAGQHN